MTEQMLRDIETQIDGTVPYYVPTLIAEVRRLQHRLIAWGCRDGHNEDDCPLCSAEHSLLNTREALTEARRVLRIAEWGKRDGWCRVCHKFEDEGHAPDCAIAAVLAQEPTR